MADMDVFSTITPQYILQDSITIISRVSKVKYTLMAEDTLSLIREASVVVVDGNFPVDTIRAICTSTHQNGVPIWFEPTSIPKCSKIIQADVLNLVTCIIISNYTQNELLY